MHSKPPSEMTESEFLDHFSELYEHSPWVAKRTHLVCAENGLDDLLSLSDALAVTLDKASYEEKLALIRAHPDLAGKAAARNELTADSTTEQSSAGLDQCNEEELKRFHEFNDAYKAKFEFPFIMAVKGSNRHLILSAFEVRLQNDTEQEFKTALDEINKIAKLRLSDFFEVSD